MWGMLVLKIIYGWKVTDRCGYLADRNESTPGVGLSDSRFRDNRIISEPDGTQPLILVHGNMGDVQSLRVWMNALDEVEMSRMAHKLAWKPCETESGPTIAMNFPREASAMSIVQFLDQVEQIKESVRVEALRQYSINPETYPNVYLAGYSMGGAAISYVASEYWLDASYHCRFDGQTENRSSDDGGGILLLPQRDCDIWFIQKWPFTLSLVVTISSPVRFHSLPLDIVWETVYYEMLSRWELVFFRLQKVEWAKYLPIIAHLQGGQTDWIVPTESTSLNYMFTNLKNESWNSAIIQFPALDQLNIGVDTIFDQHLSTTFSNSLAHQVLAPLILVNQYIWGILARDRTSDVSSELLVVRSLDILFYLTQFRYSAVNRIGKDYGNRFRYFTLKIVGLYGSEKTFSEAFELVGSVCANILLLPKCQDFVANSLARQPGSLFEILLPWSRDLIRAWPKLLLENDNGWHATLDFGEECLNPIQLDLTQTPIIFTRDARGDVRGTQPALGFIIPVPNDRISLRVSTDINFNSMQAYWILLHKDVVSRSIENPNYVISREDPPAFFAGSFRLISSIRKQHFSGHGDLLSNLHFGIESFPKLCTTPAGGFYAPAILLMPPEYNISISFQVAIDNHQLNRPIHTDGLTKIQPEPVLETAKRLNPPNMPTIASFEMQWAPLQPWDMWKSGIATVTTSSEWRKVNHSSVSCSPNPIPDVAFVISNFNASTGPRKAECTWIKRGEDLLEQECEMSFLPRRINKVQHKWDFFKQAYIQPPGSEILTTACFRSPQGFLYQQIPFKVETFSGYIKPCDEPLTLHGFIWLDTIIGYMRAHGLTAFIWGFCESLFQMSYVTIQMARLRAKRSRQTDLLLTRPEKKSGGFFSRLCVAFIDSHSPPLLGEQKSNFETAFMRFISFGFQFALAVPITYILALGYRSQMGGWDRGVLDFLRVLIPPKWLLVVFLLSASLRALIVCFTFIGSLMMPLRYYWCRPLLIALGIAIFVISPSLTPFALLLWGFYLLGKEARSNCIRAGGFSSNPTQFLPLCSDEDKTIIDIHSAVSCPLEIRLHTSFILLVVTLLVGNFLHCGYFFLTQIQFITGFSPSYSGLPLSVYGTTIYSLIHPERPRSCTYILALIYHFWLSQAAIVVGMLSIHQRKKPPLNLSSPVHAIVYSTLATLGLLITR